MLVNVVCVCVNDDEAVKNRPAIFCVYISEAASVAVTWAKEKREAAVGGRFSSAFSSLSIRL